MLTNRTCTVLCLALVAAAGLAAGAAADPLEDTEDSLDKDGGGLGANVSFELREDQTPEDGGTATVEVRVSNDSTFTSVEVTHNVTGGTASEAAFEGGNGTLTFDEPGQVRTVNLTLQDDDVHVGDVTVELQLSSDDALVTFDVRNHTHTILEDDPANQAPSAPDTSITVEAGSTWSGSLPGSDPDGDVLAWSLAVPPERGTADVDSTGAVTYTPELGYVGDDVFSYRVSDGLDDAVGHVEVTVVPGGGDDGSSGSTGDGSGTEDGGTGDGGTTDGTGDGDGSTESTDTTSGASGDPASPGAGSDGSGEAASDGGSGADGGLDAGWWILVGFLGVLVSGGVVAYAFYRSQYSRY